MSTDVKITQSTVEATKSFLEEFLKWMSENPALGIFILSWIFVLVFWLTLFIIARKSNKSIKEALLNGGEENKDGDNTENRRKND